LLLRELPGRAYELSAASLHGLVMTHPRSSPDEKDSPTNGVPETWDAFEVFVREQYASLCSYALRYVREHDVAEEVVQDVLLRVWKQRERVLHLDLATYVYRSVANAAISRLRTEKAIVTRDQVLALYDEERVSVQESNTAQLEADIRAAIESLPEKCRTVFLLSRDAGLSYAQIGERMGIATKTVESHMVKALRELRVALKAHLGVIVAAAMGVAGLMG
jgi:RNA polymerase sigma-70 factor (ECF subfamily)